MSEIVVKGLVLQSADYHESSRMLTVLTDQLGKISVVARGTKRKNSHTATASQPFAFSEMVLNENRERFYLCETSVIELFSGLANDIGSFSLASYFLELLNVACPEGEEQAELLVFTLNALWLLSKGEKKQELIKSCFELRSMAFLGFCPDLNGCASCEKEVFDDAVLDLRGGTLFCRECAESKAEKPYYLDTSVLSAMKYIITAEIKKVFSFTMSDKGLKQLSAVTERYVREQLERNFSTLNYYKQLK